MGSSWQTFTRQDIPAHIRCQFEQQYRARFLDGNRIQEYCDSDHSINSFSPQISECLEQMNFKKCADGYWFLSQSF